MLSRVTIQNFKSIGEPGVDLELKPLTFLVGPNGGGKSSILEAIGVTAQGSPTGKVTNFPSWDDVIHKPDGSLTVIDIYFAQNENPNAVPGRGITVTPESVNIEQLNGNQRGGLPNSIEELIKRLVVILQGNTFLISSVRGSIPYTSNANAYPDWVGTQGQNLIPLLARILGQRRNKQIANTIVKWAGRFEINGLSAGLWESDKIGSDYLDSELKVALNLALSSSGAKQILTIITQLFWSPKDSLLMIEEPEISLHPQAQIDAMEMVAEAIKEDKQIIATTHGLFMIQAIGYAIQKGWLEPDQVAVYHIEKKKDTGTIAKRLPLNKRGYIKGWIPSFARVERKLLNEWVKDLPEA